MRRLTGAIAACAAILVAWPAFADPPPVEAYGRLPAVAGAAISPDGSKVALAVNNDGQSAVVVFDVTQQRQLFSARVGEHQELRGVGWADDGRVSFVISRAMRPNEVLPANYYYRGAPGRVEFFGPAFSILPANKCGCSARTGKFGAIRAQS